MNNPIVKNSHSLSWNGSQDCTFTAEITNGFITELHFCEPPAKIGDEKQCCLTSVNEPYIRQVHEFLGDLLDYMDKQRAATGTFKVDVIDKPKPEISQELKD